MERGCAPWNAAVHRILGMRVPRARREYLAEPGFPASTGTPDVAIGVSDVWLRNVGGSGPSAAQVRGPDPPAR